MAVASAGPYASLHLAPDRQPCQHPAAQVFYRPDALPAAQPTASKHCLCPYILWFLCVLFECSKNVKLATVSQKRCVILHKVAYCCDTFKMVSNI